jgi:hypothetical protein
MILKRIEKGGLIKALYDSSNVLGSIYNTTTSDLDLIFKSGQKYRYKGVSKSDYMRLEIAESQGQVFNTHIKKYVFEKLDKVDPTKILEEADDLKSKEEKALRDAKRLELVDKMKYAIHVNDAIVLGKNTTEEAESLFNKTLQEIQILLNDLLTPKIQDNE